QVSPVSHSDILVSLFGTSARTRPDGGRRLENRRKHWRTRSRYISQISQVAVTGESGDPTTFKGLGQETHPTKGITEDITTSSPGRTTSASPATAAALAHAGLRGPRGHWCSRSDPPRRGRSIS